MVERGVPGPIRVVGEGDARDNVVGGVVLESAFSAQRSGVTGLDVEGEGLAGVEETVDEAIQIFLVADEPIIAVAQDVSVEIY
jgi:hypothetical protein